MPMRHSVIPQPHYDRGAIPDCPSCTASSKASTGEAVVSGFVQIIRFDRNVGFLKYWTSAQIPNLLIVAPVLAVSLIGTYRYLGGLLNPNETKKRPHDSLSMLPFHLHHLAMTFLLIFSSHTQIALRVISGDPVVWWNLTALSFDWTNANELRDMTSSGRAWMWWTVIWGAVSLVLWSGHYPPA